MTSDKQNVVVPHLRLKSTNDIDGTSGASKPNEGLRARPDHRREDSDDLRRLAALPSPSRFAPPVSFYQALPAVRFATPVMRGGHFRNPLPPNAAELTSRHSQPRYHVMCTTQRLALGGHRLRLSDGHPWAWGSLGSLSRVSQHGCCTRVRGERSTQSAQHLSCQPGTSRPSVVTSAWT